MKEVKVYFADEFFDKIQKRLSRSLQTGLLVTGYDYISDAMIQIVAAIEKGDSTTMVNFLEKQMPDKIT